MAAWRLLRAALACTVVLAGPCGAAGFEPIEIPAAAGAPPIQAAIWTPCADPPGRIELGPFTLPATRNCAVQGRSLPLVVISHGNRGTRFGHFDTAIALADAGFVAVSFNHPGNSFGDNDAENTLGVFESRVTDTRRVIDFVTTQWSRRETLDDRAIGAFGFSRGGYTVLALAGAVPNLAAAKDRYCVGLVSWIAPICWKLRIGTPTVSPSADPRVKAVVAVDPLNLFDAAGVARVKIPVQLWASEFGGDGVALGHVEEIKAALAPPPEFHLAAGAGHFAFLAPCPPALAKDAPEICNDRPGFDRAALHGRMNAAVVDFFKRRLAKP